MNQNHANPVIAALLGAGVPSYAIDEPVGQDLGAWITTVDGGRISFGEVTMDSDGNRLGRGWWGWARYDGSRIIRTGGSRDLNLEAAEVARQVGIPGSISAEE
jgi:hypothetical protein